MKQTMKGLARLVAVLLALVLAYVGYVWFSYSRLPDDQVLGVEGAPAAVIQPGQVMKIATSNIGFGAYNAEYSFFMDGGKYSRAVSEQAVLDNTAGIGGVLADADIDIAVLQEVDLRADRSWHVNQYDMLKQRFPDFAAFNAVCFDTPFLMYPPTQPIGASKACIATLSRFPVLEARRYSLPIAQDFTKLFDLDRCFTMARMPVDNGKQLCVFNVHMSAYTDDESIQRGQIDKLLGAMQAEFEKGNYVVCGGDFNHDLPGDSAARFGFGNGEMSWSKPFPRALLPEGFSIVADAGIPSCRNANEPYQPGHTFVITVDGFIVSSNVNPISVANLDTGFAFSDHNPVVMEFALR